AEDDLTIGRLDVIGTAGPNAATRRQNLVSTEGGKLTLNSAGGVLVDGAVSLTQAGPDDALAIDAGVGARTTTGSTTQVNGNTQISDTVNSGGQGFGDNLKIFTPTGSIAITDPTGKLGGTLTLSGDHVFAGSSQAATDLTGLADVTARSDRLAINDGPVNNDGYIRANGIVFDVYDGLFIQNSGTSNGMPDTRAGFTVGSGSAILFTRDDGVEVAINGRIIQNDGTVLTGKAVLDVLFPINNRDDVNVADGSTVNGCVIGKPCGISLPGSVTQIQDILDELTLLNSQTPDPFRFTFQSPQLVSFSDLAPLGLAPLIDEPVTGAGNEDLWTGIGFGIDQGDQGATTIEDKKKR
ncbi:MAG: hypothetical protein JOY99_04090, partial [Sphingomonadaceae bacterium]|nr:hypothetical protein [Sphingomonadaceae bacterium]